MLVSLNEAKKYAIEKVAELTGEEIREEEKDIIEMALEQDFFDKVSEIISEEELEKALLTSPEEMEGYLFHRIPNYTTLLEEVTIEFLSDYLSEEEEEDLRT
ncbi:MAG: hypothetical protein WCJ39_01155 [bacterium]